MSPQRVRPVSDRRRDAGGTHIATGCRVEQVKVDCVHGVLLFRLRTRGEVVGRGRSNRLQVRFAGERGWLPASTGDGHD